MARRLCDSDAGFTILELLFVVAISGTLAAIAVPQSLRALDDFRTRAAAQYLTQRLHALRFQAIKRSTVHGLRFEPAAADYRLTLVADGNGNGLRTSEIRSGVDRTLSEPESIAGHFPGVVFGILDNVPDADGAASGGPDGVRVGSSRILSMDADGSATSGTLYLLRYDAVRRRWVESS
jgi:prepilin-type N-terminal cleavage/methylation domain-containing protein